MERNLHYQVYTTVQNTTNTLANAAAESDTGGSQRSQKELISIIRGYETK